MPYYNLTLKGRHGDFAYGPIDFGDYLEAVYMGNEHEFKIENAPRSHQGWGCDLLVTLGPDLTAPVNMRFVTGSKLSRGMLEGRRVGEHLKLTVTGPRYACGGSVRYYALVVNGQTFENGRRVRVS